MSISVPQWQQMGRLRTLAGHRIFTLDSDPGADERPAILLIHGYPTASWDWEPLWPLLQADFRLVALDLLGFGFSDKPYPHPYLISEQADIVEALVAELGLRSFHVLAHDYGDTVVQELLYRQNTRARPQWLSVCLLNGGLFPETHHARLIQKMMLTPMAPLLTAMMKEKQLQKTLQKIFGPKTQPTTELVDGFWELINHNNGRRVLTKLISYMPQRILHRERWVTALQNSCAPIGLINGSVDPISGAHMVARFLDVVGEPAYRLALPTIGHYPQVEAPEAVARGYRDFLQKL
ncbi:MAG TPA: alpha/beta hydrolase [Dongiaceae bacterium]|nr:alpha/beta hydrolase [Dongiaceae bacterium]